MLELPTTETASASEIALPITSLCLLLIVRLLRSSQRLHMRFAK
nr:hypothetical protein [uncultured Flavobacterium sp.]